MSDCHCDWPGCPLDGLLAEIEKGAATADHGSVEDGPAFARGARWAASLIALRAALRDEGETT